MAYLTLIPGEFTMSREAVTELLKQELAEENPTVEVEIPIAGRLYFTETEELIAQFELAAHVGNNLAQACEERGTCEFGDIDAHESVVFTFPLINAGAFVDKLWEVIPLFLEEDLRQEEGFDDDAGSEVWSVACGISEEEDRSKFQFTELFERVDDLKEFAANRGYGDY